MILERSYIESVVREIADQYEVKQIELVGDYRRAKAKEDRGIDLIILDDSDRKLMTDWRKWSTSACNQIWRRGLVSRPVEQIQSKLRLIWKSRLPGYKDPA